MTLTTKVKPISCLTPNDPIVIEFADKWKTSRNATSRELIERVIEVSKKFNYLHINWTKDLENLTGGPASVIEGLFKVGLIQTIWDSRENITTLALESIDGKSSNALIEILELDADIVMTAHDPEKREYGIFEWVWKNWEGMWHIERTCYRTLGLSLTHIDTLWTSIQEEASEEMIEKMYTYIQKHRRLIHLLVKYLNSTFYPEKKDLHNSVEELHTRWEALKLFREWPIDEAVLETFNTSITNHKKVCDIFIDNYEERNYMKE